MNPEQIKAYFAFLDKHNFKVDISPTINKVVDVQALALREDPNYEGKKR